MNHKIAIINCIKTITVKHCNIFTDVAQNTLGYEPKDRIFVDGAGYKWTMVQKQGFPSDGKNNKRIKKC